MVRRNSQVLLGCRRHPYVMDAMLGEQPDDSMAYCAIPEVDKDSLSRSYTFQVILIYEMQCCNVASRYMLWGMKSHGDFGYSMGRHCDVRSRYCARTGRDYTITKLKICAVSLSLYDARDITHVYEVTVSASIKFRGVLQNN